MQPLPLTGHQFSYLQNGSGLEQLAWKGPPFSGTLSLSGSRSHLAGASQALEVGCRCPEIRFQVGMSPRPGLGSEWA